jgi:hypothetical protein
MAAASPRRQLRALVDGRCEQARRGSGHMNDGLLATELFVYEPSTTQVSIELMLLAEGRRSFAILRRAAMAGEVCGAPCKCRCPPSMNKQSYASLVALVLYRWW